MIGDVDWSKFFFEWALPLTLLLTFWGLIILVLVGLVRGRGRAPARSAALRILEERYARGEINGDEFVERRRVLVRDGEPNEQTR